MSHIYCQECGFQNPEAANYCARCGALPVKDAGGTEATQTFTAEQADDAPAAALEDLGVEFGQGFLIGRPEADPVVPRRGQVLRLAGARDRLAAAVGGQFSVEAMEE